MKETEKWKIYPMDIVFTLFSLVLLLYSVGKHVTEQTPMNFSNPMVEGYTIICAMALFVAICILNKPDDERFNFFITQCLNFVVWWLTTLVTYFILTAGPVSEILGNMFMLTLLFFILAFAEVLAGIIISLEFRNRL